MELCAIIRVPLKNITEFMLLVFKRISNSQHGGTSGAEAQPFFLHKDFFTIFAIVYHILFFLLFFKPKYEKRRKTVYRLNAPILSIC